MDGEIGKEEEGRGGGEAWMEVGKGEKRKEGLRLKRTSPCPRSNETGIIQRGLEIRTLPLAFHHILPHTHLGCVYSKWMQQPHTEPSLRIAERESLITMRLNWCHFCSPEKHLIAFHKRSSLPYTPETHICVSCSRANNKKPPVTDTSNYQMHVAPLG